MKKLLKSVSRAVIALVILIVLGVVAVSLLADNAVKMAVETAGSKALDVPVNVEKADLSILGGTLDLQDVKVANPPGYQQETLLDLSQGDIHIDAKSLLSKTVIIKDIKLDGMNVHLEQKGLENNLREVIRKLQSDQDPSGKKLQIDSLEISHIVVTVKLLPIPGRSDTLTLDIAPIKLTHLGRDRPLDTAALVTTVLLAVAEGITEQGGEVLPKDMITGLNGALNKAIDIGRFIFGNDPNGGNEAEKLGRGIIEGLGGLINGSNTDQQ